MTLLQEFLHSSMRHRAYNNTHISHTLMLDVLLLLGRSGTVVDVDGSIRRGAMATSVTTPMVADSEVSSATGDEDVPIRPSTFNASAVSLFDPGTSRMLGPQFVCRAHSFS